MLTRIRDALTGLWHSPTFLCYWADRPSPLNVAFALICLAFSAIVFTVYHPPSQFILRHYIASADPNWPHDDSLALCDEIDLKDTSTILANFTSQSWNCFVFKDYIGSLELNISSLEVPGGAMPFDFRWSLGSPAATLRCAVCSAMEDVFLNISSNSLSNLKEYTLELSQELTLACNLTLIWRARRDSPAKLHWAIGVMFVGWAVSITSAPALGYLIYCTIFFFFSHGRDEDDNDNKHDSLSGTERSTTGLADQDHHLHLNPHDTYHELETIDLEIEVPKHEDTTVGLHDYHDS